MTEGSLTDGFTVPRFSQLKSPIRKSERTACQYRTSDEVILWPIHLAGVEYLTSGLLTQHLNKLPHLCKSAIKFHYKTHNSIPFSELSINNLRLYIQSNGSLSHHIYELLMNNTLSVVIKESGNDKRLIKLDASVLKVVGFNESQAILPTSPRTFEGYRLLREYFSFPEKFMFFDIELSDNLLRQFESDNLEIFVLFDNEFSVLENTVDASFFALFCVPAINLFKKRSDRIQIKDKWSEYHLVIDRTRPMDFELYSIEKMTGYGVKNEDKYQFHPFYQQTTNVDAEARYYTLKRKPRVLSSRQKIEGFRSSYAGNEVFVSLVDKNEVPFSTDLRQLSFNTLCTNRDLPLLMPIGKGKTDFFLESGAPVEQIRCVAGPTKPKSALSEGHLSWKLVNHLSLNYLSLINNDSQSGAEAIKELLKLYSDHNNLFVNKQIEGLISIESQSIVRKLPVSGPVSFARGLEIRLTFVEENFEGSGIYLLASVLERFFARYVSINSFTEMVLISDERGEIRRWKPTIGLRHIA
jgi:type VI secretion system protein ImpG